MKQEMIKKIVPFLALTGILLLTIFNTGCKKNKQLESGGELHFSTDTLSFDTVFTTQGSFTLGIKIYNPQDQKVVVSSVRMQAGNNSYFHLNVDGVAGNDVKNVEIAANDSAFVFATVKLDPNADNAPFVIEDKLIATLNGTDFSIPVIAYGQNAHYIVDSALTTNQTWLTDKPYVIIHSAQVDSNVSLTIPAGCHVYMHQDSRLVVYGTLKVLGAKNDTVVFQGDRLDRAYFGYEGYPGEWGGIYFSTSSKNNVMQYALLKNGGNSALGAAPALIQLNPDSFATATPMLTMDKVILQNSIGYGLLAFNSTLKATNCLIHTCGAQNVALVQGGRYELTNCTIVNNGSDKVSHVDNSSLIVLNYFSPSQGVVYVSPMNTTINNCVVYGSLDNEVVIDSTTYTPSPCVVKLNHCLFKADPASIRPWVQQDNGMKYNIDPKFDSTATEHWNFRPQAGSPLIDAGIAAGVADDLDGNARTGLPDIGAYEYRP